MSGFLTRERDRGRPCEWKGCKARATTHAYLCLRHWRKAPKAMRDALMGAVANVAMRRPEAYDHYIEALRKIRAFVRKQRA